MSQQTYLTSADESNKWCSLQISQSGISITVKATLFLFLRQNISLTWRCHRFQQVLQFLSLCLAPMALKLGGILIVLQLLRHENTSNSCNTRKGYKEPQPMDLDPSLAF